MVLCTPVAAHPLEFLLGNIVPVVAGPILTGMHAHVVYMWTALAISATCVAHSGLSMPQYISPFKDAGFHDLHHSSFKNNYGTLGVLDWVFGTGVYPKPARRKV